MLFYTGLLIASLLVALIVRWVYCSSKYNASSVYSTVISGVAEGPTSHVKAHATPVTTGGSASPWGWKNHETPANAAKMYAALPTEKLHWDWSGNKNEIHEHHPHHGPHGYSAKSNRADTQKVSAGWPHREDKFEFAGKAYKVTRKVTPRTTDTAGADKPWGW